MKEGKGIPGAFCPTNPHFVFSTLAHCDLESNLFLAPPPVKQVKPSRCTSKSLPQGQICGQICNDHVDHYLYYTQKDIVRGLTHTLRHKTEIGFLTDNDRF
ncbi:hypothetical protein AMECASPLE_027602 [Ameca splendens]|uniref:Uncharacterized protein n=1 Tax=Ameca splendens TaxID=208324 RepID=A0ABV0ZR18_9TELE